MTCHFDATPVANQLRALRHTTVDIANDLVAMRCRYHRPHVHALFIAGAHHQFFGALFQFGHDHIGYLTHRNHGGDRHTALASRAIGCSHDCIRGEIQLGIGHHNGVIFGTAQGLHTLAVARGGFVNIFRNRSRANKRNRAHIGMSEQAIHRFLVSRHHIEYAIGQTGFF